MGASGTNTKNIRTKDSINTMIFSIREAAANPSTSQYGGTQTGDPSK